MINLNLPHEFVPLQGTGHFMGIGTKKYVTASVRRPGNRTANKFPSCTPRQAQKWDIRYKTKNRALRFKYNLKEK